MQEIYFDTPTNYPHSKFYYEGSNPLILDRIINIIDKNLSEIKHIYIAYYLFNNSILYSYIKRICHSHDIKIKIISIPLEGYDKENPKRLTSHSREKETPENKVSKFDMAKEIYDDIQRSSSENFRFYIFPHLYIRSPNIRPFSRGGMPYSLHIKHIYIETKSGNSIIGLSSSNLAVRDLPKEENMIFFKADNTQKNEVLNFYKGLILNSIPIQEFNKDKEYTNYKLEEIQYAQGAGSIFIAPFFEDSATHAETLLKELIRKAQKRILIVAQHLSAFKISYQDEKGKQVKRNGFLYEVLDKAKGKIPVYCLSQTYPYTKSKQFRSTKNQKSFSQFIEACQDIPSLHYKVNKNIHSKYIIIDDLVVVTSCNFTPTQFIYTKTKIDRFKHMPDKAYEGIHCEVGVFYSFNEKETVENYVKNFRKLWTDINSVQTIN